MTHLVRYRMGTGPVRLGRLDNQFVRPLRAPTLADLLGLDRAGFEAALDDPLDEEVQLDAISLLAPIDGATPVWAAGVTYETSRDARVEESDSHDVYTRVYSADRPELFFKATGDAVMTDGDPVGRRDDSTNDTPEPELGLVVNRHGEIVAYAVVNDMSSRSIEGENPLYLPQAKMFVGSCVIAPTLRPAREIIDPTDLTISMTIERNGATIFAGEASTSRLHRRLDELVQYLFASLAFPAGVVLSTGTCLVPDLDAPTVDGDVVHISIDGVGATTNTVTPTSVLLGN